MDTISRDLSRDLHNPTAFEVPAPPEEFGQDGGKFYRAYDALAGEIDEDTVTSLKEQLDGMLIFAGLFAGVNTAFLALTIPLLSADPLEDTNALLSSILLRLSTEQNSTIPDQSDLPSAGFSPSGDILAINALFGLSLTFAIISSFLAMLGRQWLVYYRKRSGGGPDRQRWEQLKRLLGAQRWRLELILDDVLPSLLQNGLIIFCISLIIYLHQLSPAVSIIVGIPFCLGFASFVVSALCTLWDRFCPFHSPLSHFLCWSAVLLPPVLRITSRAINVCVGIFRTNVSQFAARLKRLAISFRRPSVLENITDESLLSIHTTQVTETSGLRDIVHSRPLKGWLQDIRQGRQEEAIEFLQVIALSRAICISDDQETLLCATTNIIGITNQAQLAQLWNDIAFQERLLNQIGVSQTRMLQLRNLHLLHTAASVRRIYCAAVAHITLYLNFEWDPHSILADGIKKSQEASVLLPEEVLAVTPTSLIQTTLGFSILQLYTSPSQHFVNSFLHHFAAYSDSAERGGWELLCVIAWVASNLFVISDLEINISSIESLRKTYRGDIEHGLEILADALDVLLQPECRGIGECDRMLANILRGIEHQVIAFSKTPSRLTIEHQFTLLEICEHVLKSFQLPELARQVTEGIRFKMAAVWQQKCAGWAAKDKIPENAADVLDSYLEETGAIHGGESGHHECVEVLRVFRPAISRALGYGPTEWTMEGVISRLILLGTFNRNVLDVDHTYRRIQDQARRIRDPEERWCHSEEKMISIREFYSLPVDPPESSWATYARILENTDRSSSSE